MTATRPISPSSLFLERPGEMTGWALGIGGIVLGRLTVFLAMRRAGQRQAFVRAAERGLVPGFRVEESADGRVLMRVTSMGEGYRVSNFEEPVYQEALAAPARRAG